MKVCLIADVHANLPALLAVLEHAKEQAALEQILNLGDFIGYGAFPDEVVRWLHSLNAISVIGNYDRKVLSKKMRHKGWKNVKTSDKRLAFRWAYEQLSSKSRRLLKALPETRKLSLGGVAMMLTHGSPAAINEHLSPLTPKNRMAELAKLAGTNVVLCAHSHRAFVRKVGDVLFINPGSVGRPDDGDPRASYAILEITDGKLKALLYRVNYEVEKAARAIRHADLPEAFAKMCLLGKNYNAVVRTKRDQDEHMASKPSEGVK